MTPAERVANLDAGLFDYVESQTTLDDRRSLLAVHAALAEALGVFTYLEIGSYLGGTLQPFVADERCSRIVSIDPRLRIVPDDREELEAWDYGDNSTEAMLRGLAAVPGAELGKLETIEASTEEIAPGNFARPDLCFIDGEHTQRAALRDARFCRAVMQGAGVIAFHDFNIVERAIVKFLHEIRGPRRAYLLHTSVFVVELGSETSLMRDPRVFGQLRGRAAVWQLSNATKTSRFLLEAHLRKARLYRSARGS